MPTGALHCPNCGAASTGDARRCAYCGTRLATVQCAACFGLVFFGSRFCPHCGAEIAGKRPVDLEKLFCPRCRSSSSPAKKPLMEPVVLRDVALDECPDCCGVWVDRPTFRRICVSAVVQADVIHALGPSRGSTERTVRYLRCPLCNEQMARRNYARRSGVIVDFCATHGLWFDREELRRVVEFIRTGGLTDADGAAKIEHVEPEPQDQAAPDAKLADPYAAAMIKLLVDRLRGQ